MQYKFPIYYSKDRIFSKSQKAFQLQDSKKFGEKEEGKIIYSSYETLFLIETKKADLIKSKKSIKTEEIIKNFSKKDRNFIIKYLVFKYLRNKGYIVKTALKFGGVFRVYEKNNLGKHAKWLVSPIKQSEKINLEDFISKNRITHSTGKKLLLAIVDQEENISFYETDWIKI